MPANPGTHHGFLNAEDAALKYRLGEIELTGSRKVKVFYRHPDNETEKTYPFMTIELLDIQHATDRQESERWYYYSGTGATPAEEYMYTELDYYPSSMTSSDLDDEVEDGGFLRTEQFVPINLIYHVVSYTRSASDDRELTALMLRRVTPFRRGFIEVPEDGTIRRLDLLNWNGTDILDGESGYKKRIFRKVYTLSLSAELPASDLNTISRVLSVEGTISDHNDESSSVLASSFSEEF